MKIVYFDCLSGISGDMMLGVFVDSGVEFDCFSDVIVLLGIVNC